MPGANASNLHIGSRSEMLADYFFGTFGPVTPVRGHDDFGLDLYCALSERVGQRFLAREYFSVQVKSTHDSWDFEDAEEIRWLLEQNNPILLCVVSKKEGVVEVFHTFGRFAIPPNQVPGRLILRPGAGSAGTFCSWDQSGEIDLSAPILRASVAEFYDDVKHEQFRAVLTSWLSHERLNLDYRRMGVTRYRMPPDYKTNELAITSIQECGWYPRDSEDIRLGIRRLSDAVDCVGDQLRFLRDMKAAVRATLLFDYLRTNYPTANDSPFSWPRIQGHLVPDVVRRIRSGDETSERALDALQQELDALPRVAAAVESAKEFDPFDPFSFARPKED